MKMSNRAVVRRVALVTLGDPGIGTYTYELAEALSACGVRVDVYTHFPSCTLPLPRHHRLFPVLGSALIRQRYLLRLHAASPGTVRLDPEGAAHGPSCIPRFLKRTIRESYLSIELATWLRAQRYDFVWTQWPDLYGSRISFWSAARALGLPLVHTVHNVFPHEQAADDRAHYRHVYDRSRLVIVHSRAARDVLAREFPAVSSKILISPHGLYTTTYPRRPEARDRVRRSLGVSSVVPLVLLRPIALDRLRSSSLAGNRATLSRAQMTRLHGPVASQRNGMCSTACVSSLAFSIMTQPPSCLRRVTSSFCPTSRAMAVGYCSLLCPSVSISSQPAPGEWMNI
jgi:glycosyltransferase involved in cell wall biosynthesis